MGDVPYEQKKAEVKLNKQRNNPNGIERSNRERMTKRVYFTKYEI